MNKNLVSYSQVRLFLLLLFVFACKAPDKEAKLKDMVKSIEMQRLKAMGMHVRSLTPGPIDYVMLSPMECYSRIYSDKKDEQQKPVQTDDSTVQKYINSAHLFDYQQALQRLLAKADTTKNIYWFCTGFTVDTGGKPFIVRDVIYISKDSMKELNPNLKMDWTAEAKH